MFELKYSVAIRTLGTAGDKYLRTLESLRDQTIPPQKILVYIAEGYPLPKETIGIEEYVYVKKGMVAQRALPYTEVETEYLLCTDDDVYYPPTAIEEMFRLVKENKGDVIAPDPFPHDKLPLKIKIAMILLLSSIPWICNKYSGYGISWWGGQRYRNKVKKNVYESTTNAGMCFLCKKKDFLSIHLEDELWLDNNIPWAIGDDQIIFFKMYLNGLKVLTWYNSGIVHLDAGASLKSVTKDKAKMQTYCLAYFRTAFRLKFIHNRANKTRKVLMSTGFIFLSIYTMFISLLFNIIRKCPSLTYYGIKASKQASKDFRQGKI